MMDFYRHIMMRYARNRGYTPKGLICRYEAYKGSNEAEQALPADAKHYLKDLSGNGHDIELFNFGWSEDSGYNTTNYKGALVSDGVDDYGLCDNFPILTKDKGYTIFALRTILNPFDDTKYRCPARLGSDYMEFFGDGYRGGITTFSFGKSPLSNHIHPNNFLDIKTSKEYNGRAINRGNNENTQINKLHIFADNRGIYATSVALYALEIYDRDLTQEEIEKVKARMLYKYWKNQGADPKLPNWFNEAVVCYYDPKKQGLTNDELSADADTNSGGRGYSILKDFSHNHLDMKLHNFSGKGMSGMDGYVFDINKTIFSPFTDAELINNVLHVRRIKSPAYFLSVAHNTESFKIRIGGNNIGNVKIQFFWEDAEGKHQTRYGKGIHTLPKSIYTDRRVGFAMGYQTFEVDKEYDITFEILPSYPDALVFDGTDDYGISENQPILTDYTVMAKRKIIAYSDKYTPIASKRGSGTTGAFWFERENDTYSFGSASSARKKPTLISYQSSDSYNGINITKGPQKDTNKLSLGSLYPENLSAISKCSFALYQFLLFKRTLTQEEIDWVRKNIMGETEQKQIIE